MNLFDALTVTAFALAVGIGAVTILPRPKPAEGEAPEPARTVVVESVDARPDTVRVEPEALRAPEQRRIDALASDVRAAAKDVQEIKEAVRLQQALKSLPNE